MLEVIHAVAFHAAEWQSGDAWDCKSHYPSSILGFRLQALNALCVSCPASLLCRCHKDTTA